MGLFYATNIPFIQHKPNFMGNDKNYNYYILLFFNSLQIHLPGFTINRSKNITSDLYFLSFENNDEL